MDPADHWEVSFDAAVARIDQIESMLAPAPVQQATAAATNTSSTTTPSTTDGTFASALSNATPTAGAATATPTAATATPYAATTTRSIATTPTVSTLATASTGGAGVVSAAATQVGVAEQPPGSNDGPQIATYRGAVAGAGVGPWCAQFVSWAAKQAGEPLGEQGQGFESVSALYGWAQRTGRAEPMGSGYTPQPGDLIVWGGEHVGIVESVDPDGSIHTIEGNSGDAVTRHTYGADGGGATGFVKLS